MASSSSAGRKGHGGGKGKEVEEPNLDLLLNTSSFQILVCGERQCRERNSHSIIRESRVKCANDRASDPILLMGQAMLDKSFSSPTSLSLTLYLPLSNSLIS